MRLRRIFGLFLLSVLVPGAGELCARQDPAPSTDSGPEAKAVAEGKAPETPCVRLGTIEGFDDDASYVRSIGEQVTRLATKAAASEDVMFAVDLRLAGANLILAHQISPSCTRRLLHLPPDPDAGDDVGSLLERSQGLIEQAQAAVDGLADTDSIPKERLDQVRYRLRALTDLSNALRAYLLRPAPEEGSVSARRAASKLSPLLEDEDPAVAACAGLWQALLRAKEQDPERALITLDLAVSEPRKGAMPHAYFSRLLRCQLIAKRGGYAAAIALLMQIEEYGEVWFDDDAARQDAARAAQLVQLQVLQDWRESLKEVNQGDERRWCAERIKTLSSDVFEDNGNTVLRLAPVIPLIAPIPDESTTEGSADEGVAPPE